MAPRKRGIPSIGCDTPTPSKAASDARDGKLRGLLKMGVEDPVDRFFSRLPAPEEFDGAGMTKLQETMYYEAIRAVSLQRRSQVLSKDTHWSYISKIATDAITLSCRDRVIPDFMNALASLAAFNPPPPDSDTSKSNHLRYCLWIFQGRKDADFPIKSAASASSPPHITAPACKLCGSEGNVFACGCGIGHAAYTNHFQIKMATYFCSTLHQRECWEQHKKECRGRLGLQKAARLVRILSQTLQVFTMHHTESKVDEKKDGRVYFMKPSFDTRLCTGEFIFQTFDWERPPPHLRWTSLYAMSSSDVLEKAYGMIDSFIKRESYPSSHRLHLCFSH